MRKIELQLKVKKKKPLSLQDRNFYVYPWPLRSYP